MRIRLSQPPAGLGLGLSLATDAMVEVTLVIVQIINTMSLDIISPVLYDAGRSVQILAWALMLV